MSERLPNWVATSWRATSELPTLSLSVLVLSAFSFYTRFSCCPIDFSPTLHRVFGVLERELIYKKRLPITPDYDPTLSTVAMDAKAIEAKAKALTKAASQKETATVILGMLKDLQNGVRASEDLLRSTRIGIIVNKFKQHSSKEVAQLSGEIVSKWRNEVNKQKQGGSAASRGSSGSPRPANGTGASTPAGATPSDKASKLSVPPDKRTWKADGVDVNQLGNAVRDSCTGLMYDGLCLGSTESPKVVLAKAREVEAAAYDHLGPETKPEYKQKMRSLFQNLKNKSNALLRVRVVSGEITAHKFVRMTSDELRSEEQREKDEKLKKQNMDNAMVPQQERSISTSLQCGKCGQRKVTYTEAQTRSADEPMTLFCTCMNCGKSWRQ